MIKKNYKSFIKIEERIFYISANVTDFQIN